MSGISSSLTFVVPHAAAVTALAAIEEDKLPDDIPEDYCLYATSRNSHFEYNLRILVKEFYHDGLAYLRAWDEIVNHDPWGVVLRDQTLSSAIVGLRSFFSSLRAQPDRCVSIWDTRYGHCPPEDEIATLLNTPWPSTFSQAKEWFKSRFSDDGEEFEDVVVFLYAQLFMLEHAEANNLSVVYAVWLY